MREINADGLSIIKTYEGWEPSVYLCPAGKWTIGFGSTWNLDGAPITEDCADVSEDEGEALLRKELRHVYRSIDQLVTVELTDNQYAALCSWTYNLGSGNLEESTLLRVLNEGDYEGCSAEFPKWRKAGGEILEGLVKRRASERELFDRGEGA